MLNIKGGVGKTVLAANLFAAAHLADKRSVAFIDLDPQHNLTQYFLPPGERNRIRDEGRTIYSVFTNRPDLGAIAAPLNRIKPGKKGPRFDLVCGDERLFEYTLDTRARVQPNSCDSGRTKTMNESATPRPIMLHANAMKRTTAAVEAGREITSAV